MPQTARTKAAARGRLAAAGITPRGLPVEEAAAYVGLSARAFVEEVEKGRFPPPIPLGCGRRIWDRTALDGALDGLSGRHATPAAGQADRITAAIDAAGSSHVR